MGKKCIDGHQNASKVNMWTLFRYSTRYDLVLFMAGVLFSIISGAVFPLLSLVFGKMMDLFIESRKFSFRDSIIETPTDAKTSITNLTIDFDMDDEIDEFRRSTFTLSSFVIVIAIGNFISVSIYNWTLNRVASRQAHKIRSKFIESIFKLQIGTIETTPNLSSGSIASTLLSNLSKIEDGIGDKIGNLFNNLTVIISQLVISFAINWKLTLILLSLTPLVIASISLVQWSVTNYSDKRQKVKSLIGTLCQESFSLIKTILAFNGKRCQITKFDEISFRMKHFIIYSNIYSGVGMGMYYILTFLTYALGVYIGTKYMIPDVDTMTASMTVGNVLIVFWNVVVIAMIIVTLTPNMEAIFGAISAAQPLFDVIDHPDARDCDTNGKDVISEPIRSIEIKNLSFSYPSRPDAGVLENVSLNINSGQTVAFVGPSGSGKSCLLELLLRLYETPNDAILINGKPIQSFDAKSLRRQISAVGQEPVLFEGTISENISLGCPKDDETIDATCFKADANDFKMDAIIDAAKRGNAHQFIEKQKLKYSTILTDKVNLSGGQKQRIAIARALIRNSSLLLLDEATSALDSESGTLINEAIKREKEMNKDRITIIVAHKLDDIQDADQIYVFQNGVVLEHGSHDQLMARRGLYHEMKQNQMMGVNAKDENQNVDMNGNIPDVKSSERRSFRKSIKRRSSSVSHRFVRSPTATSDTITKIARASKSKVSTDADYSIIFKILMRTKFSLFLGIFFTIICGFWIPIYSVLIGTFTTVSEIDDADKMSFAIDNAIQFSIAGVVIGVSTILSKYFFGKVSANICLDLRHQIFSSILSKPVPWFENDDNNEGTLIFNVITNVDTITEYFNDKLPGLIINLSALASGTILALFQSWKLTLIILFIVPFHLLLALYESKSDANDDDDDTDEDMDTSNVSDIEKMAKMMISIMGSIKTITSFNLQNHFISKLDAIANEMKIKIRKAVIRRSLIVGASKSALPVIYSITFFVSAHWMSKGELKYHEFLKVVEGLLFVCFMIGEESIHTFDVKDVKQSIKSLSAIISADVDVDMTGVSVPNTDEKISGPIRFENVNFSYPSRPSQIILKNFNLDIRTGSKIAVIGESGCGKSTLSALLLKYYPPTGGNITIDGTDINDVDDDILRSSISIVNQEPDLLSCSIIDNITFGSYDDTRDIRVIEKVIKAASRAQIHETITRLPNGYLTPVGDKGGQLSGGQKQRIAIARAFYRNPNILILDEATSALDALSKKLVEESIDDMISDGDGDKIILAITHDVNNLDKYDHVYRVHNQTIESIK